MSFDFGYGQVHNALIEAAFKKKWPERSLDKLRHLHACYSFHSVGVNAFVYDFDTPLLLSHEETYNSAEPDRYDWSEGHSEQRGACRWCKEQWQLQAQSALPGQADDTLGLLQSAITASRRGDHCTVSSNIERIARASSGREMFIQQSISAVLKRLFNV